MDFPQGSYVGRYWNIPYLEVDNVQSTSRWPVQLVRMSILSIMCRLMCYRLYLSLFPTLSGFDEFVVAMTVCHMDGCMDTYYKH